MSSKLTALPTNTASSDCIIYGVEASTTDVQIPVNAANGLAGLTSTAGLTLGSTTSQNVNFLTSNLQVLGTTQATSSELLANYQAAATSSVLQFFKSRGSSIGTITALVSGDVLGEFDYMGVNSSNSIPVGYSASLQAVVDGSPGASYVPSRFDFYTGTNAAAPVLAARLNSSQQLFVTNAIQTTTYSNTVNSLGTVATVATANFTTAGVNTCTLTSGDICRFGFTAPPFSNCYVYLYVTQPASGTVGTIVLPGTVLGTVVQPTATLGITTEYIFWYDGTTYYLNYQSNQPAGTFVPYTGSTGRIVLGSSVDDGSNRLQIADSEAIYHYSADAVGPALSFYKSRNATYGSLTPISSGDVVGVSNYYGVDSSSAMVKMAYIQCVADGAPASTYVPSRLEFYTGGALTGAPTLVGSFNSSATLNLGTYEGLDVTGNGSSFQIVQTTTSNVTSAITLAAYSNSGAGGYPTLNFMNNEGSAPGNNVRSIANDILGLIQFYGVNNTPSITEAAYIEVLASGTPSTGVGSSMTFGTSSTTGSPTTALTITNAQNLIASHAIQAGGFGTVVTAIGTVTTTATVNWSAGQLQTMTLTAADTCVLTFTAPTYSGCYLTLKVTQASTPTGLITWPATCLFPVGAFTQIQAVANVVMEFTFYYDGTNYIAQTYGLTSSTSPVVEGAYLYAGANTSLGANFGKAANGSYIGWNYGSASDFDFVNQSTSAAGGFNYYTSNGTTLTNVLSISNIGTIYSPGSTVHAWPQSSETLISQITNAAVGCINDQAFLLQGVYWNGSAWIYTQSSVAAINAYCTAGALNLQTFPSGTSGGTATPTVVTTFQNTGGMKTTGAVQANAYANTTNAVGTVTTTATANFATAASNTMTGTTADNCTLTFTAPTYANTECTLAFKQPATGTVVKLTFPSNVIFQGGLVLQPVPILGATTIYSFFYDGTNYYVQDVNSTAGLLQVSQPVAASTSITSTASPGTYLTNSFPIPANSLQVGTSGRFALWVVNTGSASATLTTRLLFGTAGTTADSVINGTFVNTQGTTATAGEGFIQIYWVVRTLGSSGVIDVYTTSMNGGTSAATTGGFDVQATRGVHAATTVNTTAANFMGIAMFASTTSIYTVEAIVPEIISSAVN